MTGRIIGLVCCLMCAFPSISTGIYHFSVEPAAKSAVHTVARFLDENTEKIYKTEVDRL